jgi:hypothetical protein
MCNFHRIPYKAFGTECDPHKVIIKTRDIKSSSYIKQMFPKLLKFVVSIFLSTFFFVTALPTVPVQLNYFNLTNNILSGEIYVSKTIISC